MAKSLGHVHSIAVNQTTLSFVLIRKGEPALRLRIYKDAPNTHTISQVELARRSWMLSMVQNAYLHNKGLAVTHNDDGMVSGLELRLVLEMIDVPDSIEVPF